MLVKCDLNHDDPALPALGVMNDVLRPVQLLQKPLTLPKPMLPKLLTTRCSVQPLCTLLTLLKLALSRSQLADGQKALLKKKWKLKHSRSPLVNSLLTPQNSNLSRSPQHPDQLDTFSDVGVKDQVEEILEVDSSVCCFQKLKSVSRLHSSAPQLTRRCSMVPGISLPGHS